MANAPSCPDHAAIMRKSTAEAGKPWMIDGWYCTKRTDNGGFCKRKVTDAEWAAQNRPAPAAATTTMAAAAADPAWTAAVVADATIAAAALRMAAQVCTAHPAWFLTKESVTDFAIQAALAMAQALR